MKKITGFCLILLAALSAYAQDQKLIFTSFCQGGQDNCASVAIIKTSMYKYGIGKVVTCTPQLGGIHVLLKNGQALDLTSAELAAARAADGFVHGDNADPSDPVVVHIIGYADTLYAVEAKYISLYGYSGCENSPVNTSFNTYAAALAKISSPGVCTDNVYKYLGLSIAPGTIPNYTNGMDFSGKTGIILYNDAHAIALYANSGDGYSVLVPVANVMKLRRYRFKPKYYFILQ